MLERQNSQTLLREQETTRDNRHNLQQGKFYLCIKKISPFAPRWFRVAQESREAQESPLLEAVRGHLAPWS